MHASPDDLVIVGSGALLPGSSNSEEFFENIWQGRCFVRSLRAMEDSSYRPLFEFIYNPDKKAPDSSYSDMGADLPRGKIMELARKWKLDLEDSLALHIMAVEAVGQCLGDLPPALRAQTDFIFGCADSQAGGVGGQMKELFAEILESVQDEKTHAALAKCFDDEVERFAPGQVNLPSAEASVPSQLAEKIRRQFALGGSSFLVDAACASSFAAIYLAKLRLDQGLCRYAVVGGAEDSLGSGNMMSGFSKLGVLSEKGPRPFEEDSDGTAIGEGAVAFLLTTLRQARQDGVPILAVIRGIGGSSDGKQGGLTEPTVQGQVRCYRDAYGPLPPALHYIECHGTGTRVGDRIELASLSEFFKDREIPIGSVKYNMGHTLIAAGAVSLLKGLGVLKRRQVPPSPYFSQMVSSSKLFLNKKILSLPETGPLNVGISSFGFGGTNFHLWLQEPGLSVASSVEAAGASMAGKTSSSGRVLLCAHDEARLEDVAELFGTSQYPLPPKVWPFIDRAQLLSVLLAEKLFRDHGLHPADFDREKVHIISGTAQPLSLAREMVRRGLQSYANRLLKKHLPEFENFFSGIYERAVEDSIELNEQSAIGSINSLTASRVSKAFDFLGLNFNVDGDQSAGLRALEVARNVLAASSGAAVVFESVKVWDEKLKYLMTVGMKVYLLATPDFAEEQGLPVRGEILPLEKMEGTAHAGL